MKLINKTQRIYLTLVIVLLIVWSGVFLYAISSAIQNNIDETLQSELQAAVDQAKRKNAMEISSTQFLTVKARPGVRDTTVKFRDTTMFNSVEQETFPYRQVSTQARIGGKAYQITMRRSMVEYDDLFETILIMEIIFVALLIGGLFLINRTVLQQLWSPFYNTLQQLTGYELEGKSIEWEETEVDEFQRLNEVLKDMIAQIETEYQTLKAFSENASHEIQTPISSMLNRIEIMLQDESLSEDQWQRLQQVEHAARKLSRLNKALLLLTKIENRQYPQSKAVDLADLMKNLVPEYRSLAEAKNISMDLNIESGAIVEMNPELAEMMLRNLLSNAIKHNVNDGRIDISLRSDSLAIVNTGPEPEDDLDEYFERFKKQNTSSDSLGLGLPIVLAITKDSNLTINYYYKDGVYVVELDY
ncbi:MAG TPA: HAMP domain-containing sensor histidine kinase [Balneolaceae bacterium]|nr:HAMP domain-containing sensor histidine kinase [Balneolaceae bacterium]